MTLEVCAASCCALSGNTAMQAASKAHIPILRIPALQISIVLRPFMRASSLRTP